MILSAFLSVLPILLLFVLMMGFKVSGDKSAFVTLVVTLALGALAPSIGFAPEHFTLAGMGWATLEGVLKAIFPILLIILAALYSYNVLLESRQIEVIKRQFTALTDDRGILVLLLVWGFGGLLEGMAGFGTAVAIPAAILISLGYKPLFSATVALIANSVPTAFGAVGVPVQTLCNEVGATTGEQVREIAAMCVVQLSPLMFVIPFVILMLTDHSRRAWLKNIALSVWVGGISLAVQYLVAKYVGVETPAILGAIASILAILLYTRLFTRRSAGLPKSEVGLAQGFRAWSVYLFILFFILVSGPLCPPVHHFLNSTLMMEITTPFHFKFGWISNAGFMLFLGTWCGGFVQGLSVRQLVTIFLRTIIGLRKTTVTIISLVAMASVMNYSGMTTTLAIALASVTGAAYPLFAPLIGAIGTFVTGSDTSSNILFAKLQSNVAAQLNYPDPHWLAAANTTGATGGKIISPQSIAIATAACDMPGSDGEILRRALPYAALYIVAGGLMVLLAA